MPQDQNLWTDSCMFYFFVWWDVSRVSKYIGLCRLPSKFNISWILTVFISIFEVSLCSIFCNLPSFFLISLILTVFIDFFKVSLCSLFCNLPSFFLISLILTVFIDFFDVSLCSLFYNLPSFFLIFLISTVFYNIIHRIPIFKRSYLRNSSDSVSSMARVWRRKSKHTEQLSFCVFGFSG